jgi:ribosomal protein L40E
MKKVSEADYQDMLERLRARALTLMQQLERTPEVLPAEPAGKARRQAAHTCVRCGTRNEPDAKFCKQCGDRLGSAIA